MKKFFISTLFILGFASYTAYNYSTTNAAQSVAVTTSVPVGNTTNTVTPSTASGSSAPPTDIVALTTVPAAIIKTPVSTPTPVKTASSGQYVNGMYTGTAANAYYGNIQVEAVISGGKLTNVVFLQSPGGRNTSVYINQKAMPQLKAEAIQAQSASVSGVSGASDSSAAFKESLASALSQAKA
jgi:uncharacterized protein with FMN-binding domain